jgi:hypothetical protein
MATFDLPIVVLLIVRPSGHLPHKRAIISLVNIISCFAATAATGIFDYLLFGNDYESVVFDSFLQHDILTQLVKRRFIFGVTVLIHVWDNALFAFRHNYFQN